MCSDFITSKKSTKSNVVNGLPLLEPISEESLGIQLYEKLKKHFNNKTQDKNALINVMETEQNKTTNKAITYRSLFVMSCKLAEWMRKQNLKQNDVILMCCENHVDYFIPIIAAMFSCIIIASGNPAYTTREILHAINLSKPKLIICTKNNQEKFKTIKNIQVIVLEDVYQLVEDVTIDPLLFKPKSCDVYQQIALILFSSGTSGPFKAVMLTHRNYNARLVQLNDQRLAKTSGNADLLFVPFFHAFGFGLAIGNIFNLKTIHLMPRFDLTTLLASIEKYKITFLPLVPPVLLLLSKSPLTLKYNLTSIDTILCGAAPLSAETETAIHKLLPNAAITQGYGLSEATFAATYYLRKDLGKKTGSCGTVFPGMQIVVKDLETGALLGPNQPGEFCIKGDTVMKGYYGNLEATRSSFDDDGFLRTGDVCYYDSDGYFFIVDRLKELIKYKAYQIAPAELEALLVTNPKILDAAVIGKPDEMAGEVPMAFVVKKTNDVTEEEVMQFVADNVAGYKMLRGGVRFINAIPKSVSGKILRRELRELIKTKSNL